MEDRIVNQEAFVYRWREHATGKWYIGYHKGSPQDGYICSSQIVKPLIQARPAQWSRRILRFGTRQQMVALEHRILKRLDARRNPSSYNQTNGAQDLYQLSRWEQLGYDFTQMTSKEIAKKYQEEILTGDPVRVFLCDEWLINKLIAKRRFPSRNGILSIVSEH
jgi:hypothetical protein